MDNQQTQPGAQLKLKGWPDYPFVVKVNPAFEDERGVIANIIDQKEVEHVALITSKDGVVRANHYHPQQHQWLYALVGGWRAVFKHVITNEEKTLMVQQGHLEYCPPMWAHAYMFHGECMFLNITTGDRRSEAFDEHTIKYELI